MKNDKRRITAKERADAFLRIHSDGRFYSQAKRALIKILGDHVKAAHKRHARKNVCFRPGQPGYDITKKFKDDTRRKTS